MSAAPRMRRLTLWAWAALCLSLLFWTLAGYSWRICLLAILPLLAPLRGLLRGDRYTYAWASLFAVPYVMFTLTELLVNPAARWPAALSLLLEFAWFYAMVLYLRAAPGRRG